MHIRDYNFYIERAKERNGFKTNLDVQKALGFKGSIITYLLKGRSHLSPEKMLELAELAGIDKHIALVDLSVMKSEGEVKNAWEKIANSLKVFFAALLISSYSAPAKAEVNDGLKVLTAQCVALYYGIYRVVIIKPLQRLVSYCQKSFLQNTLHFLRIKPPQYY